MLTDCGWPGFFSAGTTFGGGGLGGGAFFGFMFGWFPDSGGTGLLLAATKPIGGGLNGVSSQLVAGL